jgi:hypothetical protein
MLRLAVPERVRRNIGGFAARGEVSPRPGARHRPRHQLRCGGRWRAGLYAGFCAGTRRHRRWPSISAGGYPPAPAAYPGDRRPPKRALADGQSSPCLALLRVGFAEPPGSPRALVRSYRTVSPLPVRRHRSVAAIGGLFSVALSCGSPRLGVTQHLALWSPDVPRTGAEARGTWPPGRLATGRSVSRDSPDNCLVNCGERDARVSRRRRRALVARGGCRGSRRTRRAPRRGPPPRRAGRG